MDHNKRGKRASVASAVVLRAAQSPLFHANPSKCCIFPPLPSNSGENAIAQQNGTWAMAVNESRGGGMTALTGRHNLLLDASLSISQPAEHSAWIEKLLQAKGSTCSWSPLIYPVAGAGGNTGASQGYRSRQNCFSLPSILLYGLRKMKFNNL